MLEATWECIQCTYINEPEANKCAACFYLRAPAAPKPTPSPTPTPTTMSQLFSSSYPSISSAPVVETVSPSVSSFISSSVSPPPAVPMKQEVEFQVPVKEVIKPIDLPLSSFDENQVKDAVKALIRKNEKEPMKIFFRSMITVFDNIIKNPDRPGAFRFVIDKPDFQRLFGPIVGYMECFEKFYYKHGTTADYKREIKLDTSIVGNGEARKIKAALEFGRDNFDSLKNNDDDDALSILLAEGVGMDVDPRTDDRERKKMDLHEPATDVPMSDEEIARRLQEQEEAAERKRRDTLRGAELASLQLIQEEMRKKKLREEEDARTAKALADKLKKEEEEKERKDRELALTIEKREAAILAEKKRREEEDEEFARKLMKELEDEKFALDLKRLFEKEERERKERLEKDMKEAKRLQDEEEAAFKERIEAERKRKEELAGPGYWTEELKKGEKFRRVKLDKQSELYRMVAERFKEAKRTIIHIEYVQNPVTWKAYCEAKKSTGIPEVIRFHGTPHQNVDGISALGILTSKDVSGGGTTIWSAENPSYSVGYSNKGPAPDGSLYMFLCRVLSTTSTVSTVRDSSHIWPEFLIKYK